MPRQVIFAHKDAQWRGQQPDFRYESVDDVESFIGQERLANRDVVIVVDGPIESLSTLARDQFARVPKGIVWTSNFAKHNEISPVWAVRASDFATRASLPRHLAVFRIAGRPPTQPEQPTLPETPIHRNQPDER